MFFVLPDVPPLGRIPIPGPIPPRPSSASSVIRIASLSEATMFRKSFVDAKIEAAKYVSNFRSCVNSQSQEDSIQSPLFVFNHLLMKHGGTTLGTDITNIVRISNMSLDPERKSKNRYLSERMEESIFQNFLSQDREQDFVNQTEEQFKDFYLSRKALGKLFRKLNTTLMVSNQVKDSFKDFSYKDKVLSALPSRASRHQGKKQIKSAPNSFQEKEMETLILDPSRGFVKANRNMSSYSSGETRTPVFFRAINGKRDNSYICNNFIILDSSMSSRAASTASRSMRSRPSGNMGAGY